MFPANNLEKYFEELNNQSWTLIPIDSTMASKLQKSAEFKYTSKLFKPAKVSHTNDLSPEIRNDCSFWLDTKSDNLLAVDLKALANFELLTTALKNYFRISLTEIECHFSVYQAGGFYKKHQDTTAANNKRIFSFIIYLNNTWTPSDGGQLIGYENGQSIFKINPIIGQMILFKSLLEHEVLMTKKTRYSLTGWIRQ